MGGCYLWSLTNDERKKKSARFDRTDEMTDSYMDRERHGNSNSEPSTPRSSANILQPNIRTVATASGNMSNLNSHYLPDVNDNTVMYRRTQYNPIQNQHNPDMGVAAVTNLHHSGMNPSSSTGVLPLPTYHGAYDQLPGSSTFAVSGVSSDNFRRSSSYADDVRASFKRKNAEAARGNFPHFDPSASSSVVPPNARHSDGVTMMDNSSLPLPQFQGNSIPSPMELGPHGSLWSGSGESVMVHEHSNLIQGNYVGQPFQPVAPPWLDQQLNNCHCDGHTTAWNQSLPMPYVQAPNVNGSSLENSNMGLQRYHDTASNINGLRFAHPPVNHQHHIYHHLAIPTRGFRGHIIFQPPVTAASYRVPANPVRNAVIPAQNGFEMGHRHVGLVPSAGLQVYHPHRGSMNDTTIGHRNLHPMGYLQVDDVAILDEVGLVDHHRDMRLDIEDMSYEELLALGEQIGNVSTGLSEESISALMKTRIYSTCTIINLEEDEETSEDQETDSCRICLENFENGQKIAILQCGHEYHAVCLKPWLLVKNICPICKLEALNPGKDKGV